MKQLMAVLTSPVQIEHSELLDNYKGREGKFIKGFLMNDKRNANGWRVDWDSILKYASDFINHPGIRFKQFGEPDHTDGRTYKENMSVQENFRVVNIVDVMTDEDTHTLNYVGEIIDKDFEDEWEAGEINMTSPAIWPEEMETVGTMDDGRPLLDVFKWRALHNAYIDDPAYKEAAFTISTCDADGESCKLQLSAKTEKEAYAVHANDNLGPLMEIPLIRKVLNSRYTSCEIKKQVQELTADTDDKNYLAKALQSLLKANPEKDNDWLLAAANAFSKQKIIAELRKY